MRWPGSSYIGEGRVRQSPPLVRPIAAAAILAAGLSGCAGLGMPFGEAADQTVATGSIQKVSAKAPDKVNQSDWEAVRHAIAGAAADGMTVGAVDWRNPTTGSSGTIAMLDTITAFNDPTCRNFATTINDTRGVRHYRGEACRMEEGRWQLFGVLADDSKLL